MMKTLQDYENRREALNLAVRHRLREERPEQVVKTAEKYLAFLQDK